MAGLPTISPEEKRQAEEKLSAVRQKIIGLTAQLQEAEDKDLPRITRDLQIQRVSYMILREVVNDLVDPTTYRELTLLNKMAEAADPEERQNLKEQEEEALAAEGRLSAIGVDPASAGHLIRAYQALEGIMDINERAREKQRSAHVGE